MYLLAILLPPYAVLACGKPFQALIALCLLPFLWFPSSIYALLIVNQYLHEENTDRLIDAIERSDRSKNRRRVISDDNPFSNPAPVPAVVLPLPAVFVCPHCRNQVGVPPHLLRQPITCPTCLGGFVPVG